MRSSGQGGIEYLILIAALVGLGIMIAYYYWTSSKSTASGASEVGSYSLNVAASKAEEVWSRV
ncbi:class III signal peptide-containing protein [Methanopyrus sp.]